MSKQVKKQTIVRYCWRVAIIIFACIIIDDSDKFCMLMVREPQRFGDLKAGQRLSVACPSSFPTSSLPSNLGYMFSLPFMPFAPSPPPHAAQSSFHFLLFSILCLVLACLSTYRTKNLHTYDVGLLHPFIVTLMASYLLVFSLDRSSLQLSNLDRSANVHG